MLPSGHLKAPHCAQVAIELLASSAVVLVVMSIALVNDRMVLDNRKPMSAFDVHEISRRFAGYKTMLCSMLRLASFARCSLAV